MTNPLVIDLSHHNPTPDWAKLKAGGTIGVIHKATEGTSFIDKTWQGRAKAALPAGICFATYHFLRPGKLSQQMEFYIGEQDKVMPLGSRVCLDHEDESVELADLEACVLAIRQNRPDLQITIYSGHVIKDQLGGRRSELLAANTSLWIAQYTSADAPSWPKATWPMWSLWQYTDSATAEGISAPVDGNRWNGTEEALRLWMSPAGAAPGPSPGPEPETTVVYVDVNVGPVPPGIEIVVRVNQP